MLVFRWCVSQRPASVAVAASAALVQRIAGSVGASVLVNVSLSVDGVEKWRWSVSRSVCWWIAPNWGIMILYWNCSVHATHTAHCGTSLRASHREGLCSAVHARKRCSHAHSSVVLG